MSLSDDGDFYDDEALEGPDDADADLLDIGDGWDEAVEASCPSCGLLILEDTPKCPHCGEWVTARTVAQQRSMTWSWPIVIVLMILGLIMLFVI